MTVILETTSYRAPLALHGIDSISGADVGDGLIAIAWPQGDPTWGRTAAPSPVSSLLGFGMLPGLHSQELAPADPGATPSGPVLLPFVVTVTDTLGRFLPEAMVVQAPVTAPVDVLLYSAPTRPRGGPRSTARYTWTWMARRQHGPSSRSRPERRPTRPSATKPAASCFTCP